MAGKAASKTLAVKLKEVKKNRTKISKKEKKLKRAKKAEKKAQPKKKVVVREGIVTAALRGDKKKVATPKVVESATVNKPYAVVELRFLPIEFQEPELRKFFKQFGKVVQCMCLRHKKTLSSKGIAFVQLEEEENIPIAVEECDGMLLGGRTVRAKKVVLTRPLPSSKLIAKRHDLDIKRRTRGPKLQRFANRISRDQLRESATATATPGVTWVGKLIKYAGKEKEQNKYLSSVGINYQYHGFENQLKGLPKSLIRKPEATKIAKLVEVEQTEVKLPRPSTTPAARASRRSQ